MEKSAREIWDKMVKPVKSAPPGWLKRREWIKQLNLGAGTFDVRMKMLIECNKAKKAIYVDDVGRRREYIWINEISPHIKKS